MAVFPLKQYVADKPDVVSRRKILETHMILKTHLKLDVDRFPLHIKCVSYSIMTIIVTSYLTFFP